MFDHAFPGSGFSRIVRIFMGSGVGRGGLRGLAVLLVLACLAPACAPKAPPLVPGPPKYPEFLQPGVPPDLAQTVAARAHDAAWARLQSGDPRRASREYEDLLRKHPAFYPAHAGLGYTALASRDYKAALAAFDRAVRQAPAYVPALVGRGEALVALKEEGAALEAFNAALEADPELHDVRRRVEVLRFRGLEDVLGEARAARRAGRLADARRRYGDALALTPDSPLVYRELAEVERQAGDLTAALGHVRKAVEIDPNDGGAAVLLGEVLEAQGDVDGAIAAYQRAQSLDAAPDLAERIDRLRRGLAYARLPQQYRELGAQPRATRADLAALIGIRLEPVVTAARPRYAGLVTDARGHWAAEWIFAVARTGLMEPLPNHTFQPNAPVRRGELAQAVARVLNVIAAKDPRVGAAWSARRVSFSDLGPGHTMYGPASAAVAAGVLDKDDNDRFGASRVVTGAEIVAAVERLEQLAQRAGFPRVKAATLP